MELAVKNYQSLNCDDRSAGFWQPLQRVDGSTHSGANRVAIGAHGRGWLRGLGGVAVAVAFVGGCNRAPSVVDTPLGDRSAQQNIESDDSKRSRAGVHPAVGPHAQSPQSGNQLSSTDAQLPSGDASAALAVVDLDTHLANLLQLANELESRFQFGEAAHQWQVICQLLQKRFGETSWQYTNAWLSYQTAVQQASFDQQQLQELKSLADARRQLDQSLKAEDWFAAESHLTRMQQTAAELLGVESHIVGRLHQSLGEVYLAQQDYSSAILYFDRALQIQQSTLGERHPETESIVLQLGRLHRRQQHWEPAVAYLKRAVSIAGHLWGEDSPSCAMRRKELGLAWQASGRSELAQQELQTALTVFRSSLPGEDQLLAETCRNLGVVCSDLKQFDRAIDYYRQAIELLADIADASDPLTIDSRQRLAAISMLEKQYLEAEGQLRQVAHQLEMSQGGSTTLAKTYFQLAVALGYQQQYHEAEPLLQKALKIQQEQLGQWHPQTRRTLSALARLYEATGNQAQADSIRQSLDRGTGGPD